MFLPFYASMPTRFIATSSVKNAIGHRRNLPAACGQDGVL